MPNFGCCTLSNQEIRRLENPNYPDITIISLLKLIAHPLRLKILRLLLYSKEICTCEIVPVFGSVIYNNDNSKYKPEGLQVQITKQLVKLEKEGILEKRKISFNSEGQPLDKADGKWSSYTIKNEYFNIIKNILGSFTMGNDIELEIINDSS